MRTHRPGQPFAIPTSGQRSVTVGDFDGDRKLDVVHWSTSGTCDQITTRTVMGAGGLSHDQSEAVPQANLCATMSLPADLDGDGRSDLVFLRYRQTNPYSSTILSYEAEIVSALSNGDATFTYSTCQSALKFNPLSASNRDPSLALGQACPGSE